MPPSSIPRAHVRRAHFLTRRGRRASLAAFVAACAVLALGAAGAQAAPFIAGFTPTTLASTVPTNGDLNPYGIVTVPNSVGLLHRGDLLISNFNNSTPPTGEQGTGTTIVQIPPGDADQTAGDAPVFAHINPAEIPGGEVGLTTALAVTRSGFVIVGSLPTSDGTSATAKAGALIVLNSYGKVVGTISGGPINGPWDMTAVDHGFYTTLYVTNVLNGTVAADTGGPSVPGNVVDGGTVVRIQLRTIPGVRPVVLSEDVIATGFPERTDPNALVIGPTGVALAPNGTLFVADTQGNRIAAIPDAPFRVSPIRHGGLTVSSGQDLNGPLGMTLAPNGDILTANGDDGNVVETTELGTQVAEVAADPSAGDLFGLTVSPRVDSVFYVDDGTNTLNVLAP
ncbi:MAG TPA: hypothetical protein VEF89_05110 [Solirubrobacteraceae bacterium]|nr:hypothetical protein [Solirubrobacteraceae bacterium]